MKHPEHYTDKEVIDRILNGETALFELLIRRNNPFLYKTGRSYHFDHDDTQDLMQDTLIDAFTHLASFAHQSSFKTWLITIMLRHCYRRQQKHSFKKAAKTTITDSAIPLFSDHQYTDTTTTVMNKELSIVIENALQAVPLDYRMVFSLREINGLNVQETAQALNITESNVKVRLNRAKTMLRKEVEKSYTAHEIYEFNLVYCDAMVDKVMNKILEK